MNVLFLSTWFPYPLSQGSKIRAYHLLRALSARHAVSLVTFAAKPVHQQWLAHLKTFCTIVSIVNETPFANTSSTQIRGWFSLKPATVHSTYSTRMAETAKQVIKQVNPEVAIAMTYVMAPYLPQSNNCLTVLDVDNLMSPWMREYYEIERRPHLRLRRWLAWQKSRRFESTLCRDVDQSLIVSDLDDQRLRAMIGHRSSQKSGKPYISVVPNGVDCHHNRPGLTANRRDHLVYSGALTYSANYDAMHFFLSDIYPLIQASKPEVTLAITGSTTSVDIEALARDETVTFMGFVDDIRIPVSEASVCIVPLRQGAGTRLKILEAMALGTPVVSTTKGAEGLDVIHGEHLLIANTPQAFAQATLLLLNDPRLAQRLAANARKLVESRYDWSIITSRFVEQIELHAAAKHTQEQAA